MNWYGGTQAIKKKQIKIEWDTKIKHVLLFKFYKAPDTNAMALYWQKTCHIMVRFPFVFLSIRMLDLSL